MAQVKLSFIGTSGAKLVVTRSLQLTVKKTTRQQKTLEGQLLMIKDGERTTISSRVAELDQIMPQYLGVSEAILDSVIFCHQDESLWPMSEPSVLKKKFDEIFEALKYTKAIDNIKVLRKNHTQELAKQKIFEDTYKQDKDRAERTERRSEILQAQIETHRDESLELTKEMQRAAEGARLKHEAKNEFGGILNELALKQDRVKQRQETLDDIRADLEELNESDEWLQSTFAQYEERQAQYKDEESQRRGHYNEVKEELAGVRKALSGKMAEQGQYQAEKSNYERQLATRETLVREAAHRHMIRGYDGDLDDPQVAEFLQRVGKLARDKSREQDRAQKATEDELGVANVVLRDLASRRAARSSDKISAKETIATNDRKSNSIQDDVNSISVDEGAKSVLDATYGELNDRLGRATTEFEEAAWDAQIHEESVKLRDVEAENERLTEEVVQSTRLASEGARLDYIKKELLDRQRSLETMKAAYGDNISEHVGGNWQPQNLERDFQAVLSRKSRAVVEAQRQRDETKRDLEQADFKLTTARDAQRKNTEDLKTATRLVLASIVVEGQPLDSVDNYLEELATIESDRDLIRADIDNFKNLTGYFTKCLSTLEQHNKCSLCDRSFSGDSKGRSFLVDKLRKKVAEDAQITLKKDLAVLDEELGHAQAARPQYDTYIRLSNGELPSLEKDITRIEEQRKALISRLEEQDSVVSQEENAKRDVEFLTKTVINISRYHEEIVGFESEITKLSSQQKFSGSLLSIDDIRGKITTCGEQSRSLRVKVNKLNADRERARALISSLELELKDTFNKLSTADHQLEKKQGLLARIQELKENNNQQRDAIQRADADLESLEPQIAKAKAQYTDAQARGRDKERELREDTSRLSDTVNRLKTASDTISAYIDRGGPGQLATCQRQIKALEQDDERLEREMADITKAVSKLRTQIENSERTKRNIKDNINFRQNTRALGVLRGEIEELESRNATEDYNRLAAEAEKLTLREQKLSAQRGTILGTMKAKDDELQRLLAEWDADYKNAAHNYREAHIKVETTKAAIEDLGRYGTALDQAIMKYHSLKMEEINRIAGELWQQTYQGTDVDTILIKSDNENATGKRNYNYRVCMVKQDAEMDMRGRCSAGQRVLASIIIRLALAECFGLNCGVSIPCYVIYLFPPFLLTRTRSLLSTNPLPTLTATISKP